MTEVTPPALRLHGISKTFGSNAALKSIDLNIEVGDFVGLLGPNGAGKSTLVKILGGVYQATGGEIYLNGIKVDSLADHPVIGFVHQDLGLIDDLSVLENLRLGEPPLRSFGPLLSRRAEGRAAEAALASVDLFFPVTTLVRDLSPAEKALVAMARVFARGAKIIFVDEVTSTLPPSDAARVTSTLSRNSEAGVTIIMVTHKLSEALNSTKRIVILIDGRVAVDRSTEGLDHAQLTDLLMNHEAARENAGEWKRKETLSPQSTFGEVLLAMRGVHYGVLGPVDLELRGGEIVGVGGLPGSGLHDLGFLAHGTVKPAEGAVELARGSKTAFVPPHRETQGGFEEQSLEENMASSSLHRWSNKIGLLNLRRQHEAANSMIAELSVSPGDRTYRFGALSGGNKQKVIFGRALLSDADVYVLCEPTRGVDVATRREIYSLVREVRDAGNAVLILSSDSEDILSVCDRISVIQNGRLSTPLPVEQITLKELEALL